MPAFNGGTYASPATWGPSTGVGYTSSDTNIGGSNKFSTGTLFAPFATSGLGDVVADDTTTVTGTPISGETFTITVKMTLPNNQPAGTYSAPVIFAAVPIF